MSPERRAELLVKELTLEEKALLMMDGSIIPPKEAANAIRD